MNFKNALLLLFGVGLLSGCVDQGQFSATAPATGGAPAPDPLPWLMDNLPGENHFSNIIQLTDGGQNRLPLWGPASQQLAFQSVRPPHSTSEQYVMSVDAGSLRQVSGLPEGPGKTEESWVTGQGSVYSGSRSPDGSQVCFHGVSDSAQESGVAEFGGAAPFGDGVPASLNLYIRNEADASISEVLNNGAVNCSPCFTPDGKQIVFSSNLGGKDFDLYIVTLDGKNLEKITTSPGFDGDPVFSPDGGRLLFVSQRNDQDPDEFNLFVADWLTDE